MYQSGFIIKEEMIDIEESWQDEMKHEPTTPPSLNIKNEELHESEGDDMHVKDTKDHANFVVKEEAIDCYESWQDYIKCETSSSLSVNKESDETGAIGEHRLNVKTELLVKEEEPDSSGEITGTSTSERNEFEFYQENKPKFHLKCTAGMCSSHIASSLPAQSHSDEMAVVISEKPSPQNVFSFRRETVTPPRIANQKPFAVASCSRAHDTMGQDEAADTYFSKEHAEQRVAGEGHKHHLDQREERNSTLSEEPNRQRKTLQSGSPKSSTCKTPVKCGQCGKTFTTRGNLTVHMRLHSGERPYKCTYCEKSFAQKNTLTNHMHIHTGERPYKCSGCGKSFMGSSSLNNHIRTHTGHMPYKCTLCENSFTHMSILISHMRTHFGYVPRGETMD